ncbi:MAG TPA: N-acetylmuramidase family protein [Blastocatellia bacterium]|nr:N-acetylmuramidase family protein [Blastocatellia bacterium]
MELSEQDFIEAASEINCERAVIKAIVEIESRGSGFLADRRPVILFEGHWFSRYTNHVYDRTHPKISYPKWTKKFYLGGAREYERFNEALALNRRAALMSTSYGLFQIMGFNFALCGFADVESFYAAMCRSERDQLRAFVNLIKSTRLDDELREKRWAAFAYQYNGESYRVNRYDERLAAAYRKHSTGQGGI